MLKRPARGAATALWGLLMAYPVTWYGPGSWAVALVVACWAVYYAVRPITWRTAAVQLASVWVGLTPVVAAADGVAPDSTTWSAFGGGVSYGTWYFVFWMAPVALMAWFFADWRARSEPMESRGV